MHQYLVHLAAIIARDRHAALRSAAESHRFAQRDGTTTRPRITNRGRR